MTNVVRSLKSNLEIALAVTSGTTAGEVLAISDMTVLTKSARHLDADYGPEIATVPVAGLANGEAICELIGISTSARLTVAGTAAVGDSVYSDGAGGYDLTSTSEAHVGFALEISASSGADIEVGLARS